MERTSKQQHFRKSTPNKEKTTGHMRMERTDQQQQQPKSIETTGVANECRSVVAVSSATSTTTTATSTYKLQRTLNSIQEKGVSWTKLPSFDFYFCNNRKIKINLKDHVEIDSNRRHQEHFLILLVVCSIVSSYVCSFCLCMKWLPHKCHMCKVCV